MMRMLAGDKPERRLSGQVFTVCISSGTTEPPLRLAGPSPEGAPQSPAQRQPASARSFALRLGASVTAAIRFQHLDVGVRLLAGLATRIVGSDVTGRTIRRRSTPRLLF